MDVWPYLTDVLRRIAAIDPGDTAPWMPCYRIAGLLPILSTGLSSGKKNPVSSGPSPSETGRTSDRCRPISDGDSEFSPLGFGAALAGPPPMNVEMRINRLLKRDEIPGFVTLAKPEPTEAITDPLAGGPLEPSPPKPVFGRRTHRIRRAL